MLYRWLLVRIVEMVSGMFWLEHEYEDEDVHEYGYEYDPRSRDGLSRRVQVPMPEARWAEACPGRAGRSPR